MLISKLVLLKAGFPEFRIFFQQIMHYFWQIMHQKSQINPELSELCNIVQYFEAKNFNVLIFWFLILLIQNCSFSKPKYGVESCFAAK